MEISPRMFLNFRKTLLKVPPFQYDRLNKAVKKDMQCTSKYGQLRISRDIRICHVRMTDIKGFLTIYGHSDNLLNNNIRYGEENVDQTDTCDTRPRVCSCCPKDWFFRRLNPLNARNNLF